MLCNKTEKNYVKEKLWNGAWNTFGEFSFPFLWPEVFSFKDGKKVFQWKTPFKLLISCPQNFPFGRNLNVMKTQQDR